MPLYEYEAQDGTRREVLLPSPRPILSWGGKRFRRVEAVPFALAGFKTLPTFGDEIMRGYRLEERRHGSRFRTRLAAEKIKRTWADELTHEKMTNRELEYLIKLARTEKILLSRLGGGDAAPGDIPVWDGDQWVPVTPEEPVGGNVRGVDLPINFVADTTDAVAVVEHNLGSGSVMVQLLTTAFDGLWAVFLAPWRVLDDNRVEVRASLGFLGPARALVSAIV